MNKTTLESLEEALERLEQIDGMYSWAHLLYEVREALAEPVKQEPVAWYDKIKGMEVSVDVSTGEDDAHHRVFGRVDSVMLESCGAQEDIILVIEESRNYAAPASAKAIRAEALEEAKEIAKTLGGSFAEEFLAAIRGLK